MRKTKDIINKQNAEAQENQVFNISKVGLEIIIKVHGKIQDRPCLVDFVIPRKHPNGHELIASKELRFMNEFQHFIIPKHEFAHFDITGKTIEFVGTVKSSTTDNDKQNQQLRDTLVKQYKTAKEYLKSLTLQLEKDPLRMKSEEYILIEGQCRDLKQMIVRMEILFHTIGKDIKNL